MSPAPRVSATDRARNLLDEAAARLDGGAYASDPSRDLTRLRVELAWAYLRLAELERRDDLDAAAREAVDRGLPAWRPPRDRQLPTDGNAWAPRWATERENEALRRREAARREAPRSENDRDGR